MVIDKNELIKNVCYTQLVYGRINKKLRVDYTNNDIEDFILGLLKNTSLSHYSRVGKNYYIANMDKNIRVTINANIFRVITVDRLQEEAM